MGLSAVYGTMKIHHGAVYVESVPEQGTTFRLYFPSTGRQNAGNAAEIAGVQEDRKNKIRSKCENKKILVIDDEEMVSTVATAQLHRAGFSVEVFNDSVAALAYFKENNEDVCLVLLDIIMPGLDGPSVFRSLKEIDAGVRVILSSGYSVSGTIQDLLQNGARAFIKKPFRINELLGAVRDVLEGTPDQKTE